MTKATLPSAIRIPGVSPRTVVHGEPLAHWAPFVVGDAMLAAGYTSEQFYLTGERIKIGRALWDNCAVVYIRREAPPGERLFSVGWRDIQPENFVRVFNAWKALSMEAVTEIATQLHPVVWPVIQRVMPGKPTAKTTAFEAAKAAFENDPS